MKTIKKIIVIGAGGTARDIIDTINEINDESDNLHYNILGFLDDDKKIVGKKKMGVKILGPIKYKNEYKDCFFINGIGKVDNIFKREEVISKLNLNIDRFETIIHPSSSISRTAKIGKGVLILRNVSVMSRAKIGNHVTIHPNAVVSHDVKLGDYCFVANGACIGGANKIGASCYFGSNSGLREYLSVGEYSIIGMGSVVLKNIPKESVYVGNPAKFLKKSR